MDVSGRLRRHGDVLLGAAVTMLYAVEMLTWPVAQPALALTVAAVSGLGLALRRRLPLVGYLLAVSSILSLDVVAPGFEGDSAGVVVTFFVALYSLGRHATGVERWLGALGVLGFMVAFIVTDPGLGEVDAADIGFALLFVGTPWAAGLSIRLRLEREHTLHERNLALERDQDARAREAVAAERARIARELHDVVSHAIAVTVLQARGGRKMVGVDQDAVRRAMDAIEHTNTQALSDMRRLLSLLRDAEDGPPQLGPQPSLERLDGLLEQVRGSGLPVRLQVSGRSDDVPPGVDLSAYRIIQEALTNVLKHAGPGTQATVEVAYREDRLDLAVLDDGTATLDGDSRGHGLVGIRERVAVVGGEVDAGPRREGGFAVRAHLPYAVDA